MKYDVTITGLSPEALEFLSPDLDLNFVIIFNDDAPAELAILHTAGNLTEPPVPGDTLKLGKKTYRSQQSATRQSTPSLPSGTARSLSAAEIPPIAPAASWWKVIRSQRMTLQTANRSRSSDQPFHPDSDDH